MKRTISLSVALWGILLLFGNNLSGQSLNGTYTVPGSYATLAAAITALNTNGISGTVIINVSAGLTETAPSGGYTLTATGTATNKIIIQKSGAGADPLLTAYTGGTATCATTAAQMDGVFRLVGSSYVTINGIDVQENAANTTNATRMEFGYGLFKANATTGSHNNIIENCKITLNKANFVTTTPAIFPPGCAGIYMGNTTNTAPNAALTISATSGLNSSNVFLNNNITNVFTGIYVVGYNAATPYTYYDQNNIIGRSGKGNIITNFGSGTSALTTYGIYMYGQNADSIAGDSINNTANSGTAHTNVLMGIYQLTSTNSTAYIYKNKVYLTQGGIASAFYGINTNFAGTGSIYVNGNTLSGANSAAATGVYAAIYNQGLCSTYNVSSNIHVASTINTSATVYFISTVGGSTGVTCTYNRVLGITKSLAGTLYGYYNATTTATSGTEVITNNYFSNLTATTGATTVYGISTSTTDNQLKNISYDTLTSLTSGTTLTYGINTDHLGNGSTISGNYIINISGAATVIAINSNTASTTEGTVNIRYNYISNIYSTAVSGTTYGIYQQNTKAVTFNITLNTITNIGPTGLTSPTAYGMRVVTGPNYTIDSNTISNFTATLASTTVSFYGIYCLGSKSGATTNIFQNTISGLTGKGTTNTNEGIYVQAGTIGGNINVYQNTITGLSGNASTTNTNYGVYIAAGLATTITKVYSNTITGNASTGTSTTTTNYGILINAGASGSTTSVYKNKINTFTGSSTTVTTYGIYSKGGVAGCLTTSIDSNSINTLTGSGSTFGIYNLSSTSGGSPTNIYADSIYGLTGVNTYGIYQGTAVLTATNIYKNIIYNNSGSGAASVSYGMYIASGSTVTIYNNYLSDIRAASTATANAVVGIYANAGTNINVYYNTIYLNATSTGATFGSSAVSFSSSVLLDLRDNILCNNSTYKGTGLTVSLLRTTATTTGVPPTTSNYASTSNYNAYYVPTGAGNNYVYADKTTAPTNKYTKGCSGLSNYISFMANGRDAVSFFELPTFNNISATPYDLHLSTTTATFCESGGANITGIADDFDGNTRQGNTGYSGTGTAPDVGANEFSGIKSTDAAPPAVTFISIPNTACTTAASLAVTITDASLVARNGNAPRLYFKKGNDATNTIATANNNTVSGWKYVTGSLSGSVYTFTLNYALINATVAVGDSIRYFIVAQDSSPAKNVFTGAATFSPACPLTITGITSSLTATMAAGVQVFKILNTIGGTYTVGATGGGVVTYPTTGFNNFASLTLANGLFDAINNCLVTGNITATINANLASETGAKKLNQWQEFTVTGCSAITTPSFTLTIKPASATTYTISGSATNSLIDFNGADRVTIDGSFGTTNTYLIFRNLSSAGTGNNTIYLENDATYNTFKYIQVEQAGKAADIYLDETIGSLGNSNTLITHCTLHDLTTGSPTLTPVYGIYMGGTGSSTNNNVTISNNQISNFSNSGINVASLDNGDNIVIKNNSIFYNSTIIPAPATQQYGIYFVPAIGSNDSISHNIIGGSTATGSGTWSNSLNIANYGIFALTGDNATIISNNRINNITSTSVGNTAQLFGIYLSDGLATISNDTISGLSSAGTKNSSIDLSTNPNNTAALIAGIENTSTNPGTNITSNLIKNLMATTTGVTMTYIAGIGLDGTSGTIQGNQIYGFTNTAKGSPAGITGIRATAGNWRYINNMISIDNSTNTNQERIVGFYDGTANTSAYYFNSVYIGGSPSTGSLTSAAWDCIAAGSTDSLNDNVFVNVRTNTGTASGNQYAISQTSSPASFVSDYNNLYSANSANIGNIGGALTFSLWQSNTGGDANGVSDSVLFKSVSTGNLLPDSTSNCYIYRTGTAISGITTDYSNKTRNSPPCMGAGEFTLNASTSATALINPVCVGNTLNLTANTSVASPKAYKWKGPNSFTSTSSTPSITNITTLYAGVYSDTITDRISCKSSGNITITINTPPTVTLSPMNASTCPSNAVTFTAAASSSPSYQWQDSGSATGGVWVNLSNSSPYSGVTTATLTVTSPPVSLNGYRYRCQFSGTAPCVVYSGTALLTVINFPAGNWLGLVSTDWTNAANWCGPVPTSTTDVTIPSGASYYPVIISNVYSRNLTINSGATITINSGGNLNATGNVTNYGKFYNSSATITLNGSTAQTLPGGLQPYNLVINNSAGVTISGKITVSNTLTLTAGILKADTVILTNNSTGALTGYQSNANSVGYSGSSYINGILKRSVTSSGTYDFPIGSRTNYELITLVHNSLTGTGSIIVKYDTSNTGCSDPSTAGISVSGTPVKNLLNGGYWEVIPDVEPTGGNYSAYLNERGYSTYPGSAYQMTLIKRNSCSAGWTAPGTHSNSTQFLAYNTGHAERSGLTSFSNFGIGWGDSPLPVTLESFDAKATNNNHTVHTSWIAATQHDNRLFNIQRSSNGSVFTSIGSIDGCGTCNEIHSYSFDDHNPLEGTTYYRLQLIDNNGAFTYSEIKPVTINSMGNADITIYPNPTTGMATVNVISPNNTNALISIRDVTGKIVLTQSAILVEGTNHVTLNTVSLPEGVYIVAVYLAADGSNTVKRLIKLK